MQTKKREFINRLCRQLFFPLAIAAACFVFSVPALADQLDERIAQLRGAEDFRVRVQAALSLGASAEKRAVVPLCQALADTNRTVRLASATALSRLKLGGKGCIKRRLAKEQDKKVKAALVSDLKKVSGQVPVAEPAIGASTIAYIAIEKLAGPTRLNSAFRQAMVKSAVSDVRVAFVPAAADLKATEALLKKHPRATGILIVPTVAKPIYSENQLRIRVSFAVFSLPERSLKGEFTQKVAMGGISGPNARAEKGLVIAAADSGMKKFIQNLSAFSN